MVGPTSLSRTLAMSCFTDLVCVVGTTDKVKEHGHRVRVGVRDPALLSSCRRGRERPQGELAKHTPNKS